MDIEIDEAKLEDLINVLEKDNIELIEQIDYIYDTMIKIEKNDWNSPEKTRMDEDFIPYLKKQSDILNKSLTSKINILKDRLRVHFSEIRY